MTDSLQNFVKRTVPIRFGLVPRIDSYAGRQQAKVVYYLLDRYGLSTALNYLTKSVTGAGRKYGAPQEKYFVQAVEGRKLRKDKVEVPFADVAADTALDERLKSAQAYVKRLGAGQASPPILINGVPIPYTDDWLQGMSQRVGLDSRMMQEAVYRETVTQDDYLPDLFLASASLRRNPSIVPEDDKDIRHINLGELPNLSAFPSLPASPDTIERELVRLTVAADFDTFNGFQQLMEALLFRKDHDNVELAALYVPSGQPESNVFSTQCGQRDSCVAHIESLLQRYNAAKPSGDASADESDLSRRLEHYWTIWDAKSTVTLSAETLQAARAPSEVTSAIGVGAGETAIVLNGRVVGPLPSSEIIEIDDLETLLAYERKKRLLPAALAIEGLGLQSKASSPLAFAFISNLIALSQVSDVPEGIFEAAPTVRTGIFKHWNSTHTAITTGDIATANVQIFSALDPASELAQRWLPIIKALSELDGVATTLFLNPKERLEDLPVKRFYRHVLDSKPTFDADGSLKPLSARFSGLPSEALLNIGMDLPPSWLVAPKDSVHDLDNIKLSAVKTGADVEATYELEHILIEGHSRDVTLGPPPRGAQLVLGTESDPHSADTIIMANLGYFQFKANPGVYNLTLQKGRSEDIFHIDSAGTMGYAPQPGDNTTETALMSFRGATLFPRLSRKPDMEEEDVLEAPQSALKNIADGAERILSQVGLSGTQTRKYLFKVTKFGSTLIPGKSKSTDLSTEVHADINIFSVASGHL